MDEFKLKIATGSIGNGASVDGDEARDINGIKVIGKIVEGLDANGTRQLSDTLLARLKSGVVVLGRTDHAAQNAADAGGDQVLRHGAEAAGELARVATHLLDGGVPAGLGLGGTSLRLGKQAPHLGAMTASVTRGLG